MVKIWHHDSALQTKVVSFATCSNAVILLLLIHCLLLLPLFVGVSFLVNVSKGAKIRNRYNQVPHLTHATNGKGTKSQNDTTNESKEVTPIPAGDHKAHINRRVQRHSKHKTEKHIQDPHKKYRLGTVSEIYVLLCCF